MLPVIQERIFSIPSRESHAIHCVYNFIDEHRPLIVLLPQFEGTVRLNSLAMLMLVANGFSVLRFDYTNHLGNSHGEFRDFTMTAGLADVGAVLDWVRSSEAVDRSAGLGLLSASIGSRLLYRYLAGNPAGVDLFCSLLGVVNLGETVRQITGLDVTDRIRNPSHQFGQVKCFRHYIDGDRFAGDMIAGDWWSLESTTADIAQMVTPTCLVLAGNDPYVNRTDCEQAFAGQSRLLVGSFNLPGGGHELYRNPEGARAATRVAVRSFQRFFAGEDAASAPLWEPSITDLIEQNGHERQREARCAGRTELIGAKNRARRSASGEE